MRRLMLAALAALLLFSSRSDAGPPYRLVFTGTAVSTSATPVDTTSGHVFVKLWNNCGQTEYVAFSSGVTVNNGIPVAANTWIEFNIDTATGNRLYAIVSGSVCDTRVMEMLP